MAEDFGFGGDEFLLGDGMDDWALGAHNLYTWVVCEGCGCEFVEENYSRCPECGREA